jgi:proteasome lid subunit RPN8/RPN11
VTAQIDPRPQAMPMDRAILWNPTSQGPRVSARAPYPIFFQQEAVVALQEHLKASPDQAVFGFLAGDVFRDPETGVLYAVIDKTLRLNQAIYGDKTEVVVARLWDRMQEQLAKASGRLLGWYHSHPGQSLSLSTHDVETHDKYFTDPWHVAVVVAVQAEGVVGGFFRSGTSSAWAETPLPFYELLQPDSIRSDGKKRSFLTWKNYKAYNPVSGKRPTPAPPSPADDLPLIRTSADDEPAPHPPSPPRPSQKPRPAAPVFVPDEPAEPPPRRPSPPPPPELPGLAPAPPAARAPRPPRRAPAPSFMLPDPQPHPAPPRRRPRGAGGGRWLTWLALLLLLGGGAAGGYWYFVLRPGGPGLPAALQRLLHRGGSSSSSTVAPPVRKGGGGGGAGGGGGGDTTFARFDRLSDTLARGIRHYDGQAALFANQQIDCAALARGLVVIEDLWITYNAERRRKIALFDARRAARDQTVYAAVDSVESQFERSGCRRP